MTRNYAIDNTKFVMMILIVFGHMIEPFVEQNILIKTAWMIVYSFHIPAFVILSGMVTKNELNSARIAKSISTILIPFFSFTILYEIVNIFVENEISNYTLKLQPYWILWFLVSLFVWKILLPIMTNFRQPILLSLIVTLGAGYFKSISYFLGLSRTLYFFPFFIIGFKLTPLILENPKFKKIPITLSFAILILNFIFFFYFRDDISYQALYGSFSYPRLEIEGWQAAFLRLGLIVISLITSMAILRLIPNQKSCLSKWGQNSLYVFLWHGFLVNLLVRFDFISFTNANYHSPLYFLYLILFISFALTIVLSTEFVKKITDNYIFLPLSWLLLRSKVTALDKNLNDKKIVK